MSKKIIQVLGFLLIAVFVTPFVTSAAIGVTWTATSTTPGYITPTLINGYAPGIGVTNDSYLNIGQNSMTAFGSSSPYANVSIHANNGETNKTLFAIGSSTASATSTLFTVTNSGNVGIGTTAPTSPLQITTSAWAKLTLETTGVTSLVRQASDGNGMNFTTNALWTGAWSRDDVTKSSFAYIQHLGNSRMEFRVAPPASGAISWNTAMVIQDTGNVGIGTTTPWAQFSINPNGITGPVFAIGSSTATNFVVTNAGTVGIGTTSPLAKLNINSGYVNSYPIWSGMYTSLATTLGATATAYGNAVQNITAVGATNAFGSHIDTITATGLNFTAAGTAITRISSSGFAVGVLIDTVSNNLGMSGRPAVGVAVTNVRTNSAGDAYGVQLLNISNASTTNTTNSVAALEIENSITNTANTANVYSIRSLSTAKSYFAGSVGVASTSPFARLSVHAPNGVNTPTLFAIGSSTQTATTTLYAVDNVGHEYTGGGTPTLSAGTFFNSANDSTGTITTTSGAGTTLTLTFAQPWATPPACNANFATTTSAIAIDTTTTAAVFTYPSVNNVKLHYQCRNSI